jgi:hypothetical protein
MTMATEGDDTGGAGGSAADLLGTGGGEDQQQQQQGDDQQQQQQQVDGGADPDWWGTLSAEGGDADNPSNMDWIKSRGTKTLDDLVKNARDAQRALRESGRVKVPGEGAKPEEIAEYRKAIGVPDDVKGYVIVAPKDGDGNDVPLDTDLIGRMSESALKRGAPKAVFEGLVGDLVQAQLDQAAEHDAAERAAADKVVKGWGGDAKEKLAAVDRSAKALGLSRNDMVGIRNVLGSEKALGMFAKLGEGMAEDVLLGGGGNRFGVSGPEAIAEIERLKSDTDFQAKLMARDPASVARWDRLNNAQAEYEQKQRAAA